MAAPLGAKAPEQIDPHLLFVKLGLRDIVLA